MKQFYTAEKARYYLYLPVWIAVFSFCQNTACAQSCPVNAISTINANPNTFYRAKQATVNAGTSSILLDSATYGATPISSGDILLIIQMQGAQLTASNSSSYGSGGASGSGYLTNSNLLAGNMEYVVASNSVPLVGGTVNLSSPLVNSYKNAPFGTDGQYTYQVVRVPIYYDLKLTGSITAPRWNGATGGMVVLYATDSLLLNSQLIDASGLGFRGGGGRSFTGSGSGNSNDYITSSVYNANGGKGEGLAGTPKYLNNNNSFLDVSASEGYPNGSYGKGAPGNAGGGGTDGNPANNNDENTGGGGGANGGIGGNGGFAWSSAIPSGGKPGAVFAQASPSRLIMGGGGGAGTTNNGTGTPGNGFASSGAAGGGIIIVMAHAIGGSGNIRSNGAAANNTVANDGSGGGGAGGSIMIFTKTGTLSNVTVSAKGGTGGSNQIAAGSSGAAHGPGGGGGGGVIYTSATINAASSIIAGVAGTTSGRTINYGATDGAAGQLIQTVLQTQTPVFPLSCVILSVNFLDVTAEPGNNGVTVGWEIAEDVNTQEYFIEKSLDAVNFTTIGQVARKLSTTNGVHYDYPDNSSLGAGAVWYYRIKEVGSTGQSMYSKVVSVRVGGISGKVAVYPNPTKGSTTVSFVSSSQGSVSLRLFDLKGSMLWQRQYQTNIGQNTIALDNFRTIPDGMYILQWFDGLKPEQVKLVVNH